MTFKLKLNRRKVTQKELKEILHYEPTTGFWTWIKVKPQNNYLLGQHAGKLDKNGYIYIQINKRIYMAHRLAWLYMTGEWPEFEIDHKDTIKSNNVWTNLRPATHNQNCYNKNTYKNNKSGQKGIYFIKKRNKYRVILTAKKQRIDLGYYESIEKAVKVRQKHADMLHKEFARHT